MDKSHSDEHRGHRLERRQTERGNVYWLPEAYSALSISESIRRLAAEGWERWEIHQVTGIRYQHVRNVLEQAANGTSLVRSATDGEERAPPVAGPQNPSAEASAQAERSTRTIGDILQAARRQIAVLAGVPEEAVKLDLRIEMPGWTPHDQA